MKKQNYFKQYQNLIAKGKTWEAINVYLAWAIVHQVCFDEFKDILRFSDLSPEEKFLMQQRGLKRLPRAEIPVLA